MLRALLAAAVATSLVACAEPPVDELDDPNAGLLRDFVGGKFDAAGHPLNAKIVEADELCGGSTTGAVRVRGLCTIALPTGAMTGGLTLSARINVRDHARAGTIATLRLFDQAGVEVGRETLTAARLRRRNAWIDLPVNVQTSNRLGRATLEIAPDARVDLRYVEVFPRALGVVVAPGSGVFRDADRITIELPAGRTLDRLEASSVDVRARLEQLIDLGRATRTTTSFRTLISVAVGDLLPTRGDIVDLRVHASGDTSRAQLRKTAPPCVFAGDPAGARVLLTGFQPFPADGWHDNVSSVAVLSARTSEMRGAQVMKLILPVEYDRAAALVTEVIERCQPAHVLSFGQGGNTIALEETAYNLQDTGELAGGVPDNRGIIRASVPIDEDAPATQATLLPLDAIEDLLVDDGAIVARSDDPGRYICNNVMFAAVGKMTGRGRAGFIHLPYATAFDATETARWGRVVERAVQATVAAP